MNALRCETAGRLRKWEILSSELMGTSESEALLPYAAIMPLSCLPCHALGLHSALEAESYYSFSFSGFS